MMRIILLLLLSFTAANADSFMYEPSERINGGKVVSLYEAGQLFEARNAVIAAAAHVPGFDYSAEETDVFTVENAIDIGASLINNYYQASQGTIPLYIAHQLAQRIEEQALREGPANAVLLDAGTLTQMKLDLSDIAEKFDYYNPKERLAKTVFFQGVIRGCLSSFVRIKMMANTATKEQLLVKLLLRSKAAIDKLEAKSAKTGGPQNIEFPPFAQACRHKSRSHSSSGSGSSGKKSHSSSSSGSSGKKSHSSSGSGSPTVRNLTVRAAAAARP